MSDKFEPTDWCERVTWPVVSDVMSACPAPLVDSHGMGAEERERRRRFLGITAEDADNLRSLRDTFRDYGRAFAERFYQHLLSDPTTAAFLRDPERLEQLKKLQTNYFAELLEGVFDAAYFEGRLRVGKAHQRAGLDPVWYLGAYNQYLQLTFPVFAQAFGENWEQVLPKLLSLVKVVFLDLGLALHTYFHEATEQLRRHNEELRQALRLYWQAQRREEQLRKLLSHEVRGGLAAVITTLEDVLDSGRESLDPATAQQLEGVSRRCWALSRLLSEMLVPAAEAHGPAWVDTAPIFDNLASRLSVYADGRPIDLRLPEHAPRVWGDAVQLREVFANLVSNAVRHLDKEPALIEIVCRADGEFYVFGVADNGTGIPAHLRERVFEPFVRGPTRPGQPEGTGLGLYFVRTVVEQGGGRVWVESTPGEGSRFWFTVPRVPPAPAPRKEAAPKGAA